MQLLINGETIQIDDAINTVQLLLAARELAAAPCAVEVNEQLVPKRQHAEHALREGDRVEIVTLVGGG